jgi:hypothetical protein
LLVVVAATTARYHQPIEVDYIHSWCKTSFRLLLATPWDNGHIGGKILFFSEKKKSYC